MLRPSVLIPVLLPVVLASCGSDAPGSAADEVSEAVRAAYAAGPVPVELRVEQPTVDRLGLAAIEGAGEVDLDPHRASALPVARLVVPGEAPIALEEVIGPVAAAVGQPATLDLGLGPTLALLDPPDRAVRLGSEDVRGETTTRLRVLPAGGADEVDVWLDGDGGLRRLRMSHPAPAGEPGPIVTTIDLGFASPSGG